MPNYPVLLMLARPEVKRTYSRLKKDEVPSTSPTNVSDPKTELELPSDCTNFDIVKPDKMRKITDFFRIKRDESSLSNPTDEIPSSSSPLTSVTKKLTQTFLDLGQKNLVSVQCPECLMHYNKSFQDDISLHKKFHLQYLKGYNFNLDPSRYRELSAPLKEFSKWSKYRFYEINKFDSHVIKKLEFFLDFVHLQLGAEPLSTDELKRNEKYSVLLAVEGESGKIIGMSLFEDKCKKVFKSLKGCCESSIELENFNIIPSEFEEIIGVSRIWVESNHRSRGIASLLLDLKCSGRRDKIAFSQPTPAGFKFSKFYQKNVNGLEDQCLIYL